MYSFKSIFVSTFYCSTWKYVYFRIQKKNLGFTVFTKRDLLLARTPSLFSSERCSLLVSNTAFDVPLL